MKLEEVLPALRAGKIIKRKSWVSLELNEKLNEILAEDWEIFGEECYQDGLKLPTKSNEQTIEERLSKLESLLKSIQVKIYNLQDTQRKMMIENKSLEKCPACNGLSFRTIFRDYPPGYSENIPCVACDSKGVLWK